MMADTLKMIPRPGLLDARAAPGLEVFQLTTETDIPSSHVYMEAQVFTSDSRRLVLHRSATPHGACREDPDHAYLLCDLENGGELSPLTEERGVTGPAVSPDDSWLYYFRDQTALNGDRLMLKRVRLDGGGRETLIVLDGPAEGAVRRISRIYPLSTISSDGRRIAVSGFLGNGRREPPPWGLLVFDLDSGSARLILEGPSWHNMHPQYCRSGKPEAECDIMVQENHGNVCRPDGTEVKSTSGAGVDVHVIRDDATCFRDLPWGRNMTEACEGHQCWRGHGHTAITSAAVRTWGDHVLIEGPPAPHDGHLGAESAGAERNMLSAEFENPRFHHFATDAAGKRLITDHTPESSPTTELYLAEFGPEAGRPLRNWKRLLDTGTPKGNSAAHAHPFLSPDGIMGFFNSTESGLLQAYLIKGLHTLK